MLPSIIASGNVFRPTYRIAAYNRSAAAYHILHQTLGDSLFKKALHQYMDRWNHKHPIPYDFFFTFDEVVGERLDWFWKPWFFESGYPDLAINDVFMENSSGQILIENMGTLPVPVKITVLYADDSESTIEKSAAVWKNRVCRLTLSFDVSKPVKKIILGSVHIPDVNKDNNEYETSESN
jgi:aminopeptidase N